MTIHGDPSGRFDCDPRECVYVEPLPRGPLRPVEGVETMRAEVMKVHGHGNKDGRDARGTG